MADTITIVGEEKPYKAVINSGLIMFRNDETDVTGVIMRMSDQTEFFNIRPLLVILRDRAAKACEACLDIETPSTMREALMELTIMKDCQPIIEGQEISKAALIVNEQVSHNTFKPRIILFNIDTYEDWAYVYGIAEKYLQEYSQKLANFSAEMPNQQGGRASTADQIDV